MASQPTPLACALDELNHTQSSLLALWRCCEIVELILRIASTVLLSHHLVRQREASREPARELSGILRQSNFNYRMPTLGMWKDLAACLAAADAKLGDGAVLPAAPRVALRDFFAKSGAGDDGVPKYESSFTALRNRLAHGAGLSDHVAEKLIELWWKRFDPFVTSQLEWLASFEMYACGAEGDDRVFAIRGLVPAVVAVPHGRAPEEVWIQRGEQHLMLWPLIIFGVPRVPSLPYKLNAVQVYSSQDGNDAQAQVFYTPYVHSRQGGGEALLYWSQGNDKVRQWLSQMLRIPVDTSLRVRLVGATESFAAEVRADAKRLVGRRPVLRTVLEQLRHGRGQSFWLHGPAGIGKSTLMAKVATRLIEAEGTLLVIYRFRLADERCNAPAFLRLVLLTLFESDGDGARAALARLDAPDADIESFRKRAVAAVVERLRALAGQGRDVVFVVDGLDEIEAQDPYFIGDVLAPLVARPDGGAGPATWLLAGRSGVGAAIHGAGVQELALGASGMPGLEPAEVWAMLLDRIGGARRDLFAGSHEVTETRPGMPASRELQIALERGRVPQELLTAIKGATWNPDPEWVPRAVAMPVPEGSVGLREWLIDDDDDAELYFVTHRAGESQFGIEARRQECPFVDSVVENSRDPSVRADDGRGKCLPLYVKFVIDDILRDQVAHTRFGGLDPAWLPKGLSQYYETLLSRLGVGGTTPLLTYLIYGLAVARESVDLASLSRLLMQDLLQGADEETREKQVRNALDSLSTVLHHRIVDMRRSWTLYHHGIREFLLDQDGSQRARRDAPFVVDARKRWAKLCAEAACNGLNAVGALAPYVGRHGVRHLCEDGDFASALALWTQLSAAPGAHPVDPALLQEQKASLSEALQVAAAQASGNAQLTAALSRIDAEQLHGLISQSYETGFNVGAIRVLIQYHEAEWPKVRERLMTPFDLVFRHDAGQAYAELWIDAHDSDKPRQMSVITELAVQADAYLREMAGYALRHICDTDPQAVHDDVIALFARGPTIMDRMIAGELMTTLAVQGRRCATLRADEPFWHPRWPYLQCDVDTLKVLAADDVAALAHDADGGLAEAAAEELRARRLRARLLDAPVIAQSPQLAPLVGGAAEMFAAARLIEEPATIDAIGRLLDSGERPLGLDLLSLMAMHPLWNVTEQVSTLLRKVVGRKPALAAGVEELLAHESWRVRYCAVDTAFNIGDLDDCRLFRRALQMCGSDPHCRVRGICADDLLGWIRLSTADERRAILQDANIETTVASWLRTADDFWLLEYLYLLFRFLRTNTQAFDSDAVTRLLAGPRIRFLQIDGAEFFELAHGEFMRRIDGLRAQDCNGSADLAQGLQDG